MGSTGSLESAQWRLLVVFSSLCPLRPWIEVYLPWRLADLSHGRDATAVSSFRGLRVLSISTVAPGKIGKSKFQGCSSLIQESLFLKGAGRGVQSQGFAF